MARRGPKRIVFDVTNAVLEEVRILAGQGLTQGQIYSYFCISKDTWYDTLKINPALKTALRQGKAKAIVFVTGKLFELIKEKNFKAIELYLRVQGGWTDEEGNDIFDDDSEAPVIKRLKLNTNDPIEASKVYQQIMSGD